MALLGKVRYNEFEVHMIDDVGNMLIEYVLAPDVERAAWQAMELSDRLRTIFPKRDYPKLLFYKDLGLKELLFLKRHRNMI